MEFIIETVKMIFIAGFLFFMVMMVLNHKMRIKGYVTESKNPQNNVFKRNMVTGLALLCIVFVVALTVLNGIHTWSGARWDSASIWTDPHYRREAINKIIDSVKLIIIFCFVGIGTRLVLNYREQMFRMKIDAEEKNSQE